jgi:rubredoxin-NAD+ reductase
MNPLIIIGAGMAGITLAREFRKLDKTTPILIITADDGGFYAKPMLSNALAQNKAAAQLLTQTAEQLSTQLQCTILPRTVVTSIDTAAQTVASADQNWQYSKLVLASGAQAIRLPIDGNAFDQVLSVNSLDDYALFRERLEQIPAQARVALIGGGLIGCEFADDLAGKGYAVTVIDLNALPLAALSPPAIGAGLQAALATRGVQMQLGTSVQSIDHADAVDAGNKALRLTLANGQTLVADLVLSAVGLRADLRLAQAAGLRCERGIVLDPCGQTSAPQVYALGDCAQYTSNDGYSRTLPYIAPIMAAGRALAKTLTGTPTEIDMKPVPVIVKTPSYPIALVPPAIGAKGQWQHEMREAGSVCRFFDEAGRMSGFAMAQQDAATRNALMAELVTM